MSKFPLGDVASRRVLAGSVLAGLVCASAPLWSALAPQDADASVPDFSSNNAGWIAFSDESLFPGDHAPSASISTAPKTTDPISATYPIPQADKPDF
jgi:hypothetical protein